MIWEVLKVMVVCTDISGRSNDDWLGNIRRWRLILPPVQIVRCRLCFSSAAASPLLFTLINCFEI